jgi:hypothetical protein
MHYWKEDGRYHRVRSFNEGVAASTHDIVMLLDDDVIPASDYWAYTAASSLASNPGVSILRMPLVMKEMKHDLSDAPSRRTEFENLGWDETPNFPTYNVAILRQSWDLVGGLGWAFNGVYGDEDLDFHRRAGEKGLRYGMSPKSGCGIHVGLFFGNRDTKKARRSG